MKTYQNRDDFLSHKRKFTDEEYLKYYNLGYSDVRIAKILHCSYSSVRTRRMKLKLLANFYNFNGEQQTIETATHELLHQRKRQANRRKTRYHNDSGFNQEIKDARKINFRKHYVESYVKNRDKLLNRGAIYYKSNREKILDKLHEKRRKIKQEGQAYNEKSLC